MGDNKKQTRAAVEEVERENDRVVPVRILYDYQRYGISRLIPKLSEKLSAQLKDQGYDVEIDISLSPPYELEKKVSGNWDIIMMHVAGVGREGSGSFSQYVDKIRDLSHAILVADSAICPEGEKEILESFDYYIQTPTMYHGGINFVKLLKELKYIPESERRKLWLWFGWCL